MAGRKRRARPGYKAAILRYYTQGHKAKNKEARGLRHELNVESQTAKTAKRDELFELVVTKYKLDSRGKYALTRLLGTVNASRLGSILDYRYRMENWFLEKMKKVDVVKKVKFLKYMWLNNYFGRVFLKKGYNKYFSTQPLGEQINHEEGKL